jgi:predicted ferric reductase
LSLRGIAGSVLWLGLYVVLVRWPVPWVALGAGSTRAFPEQLGATLGTLALSILALQFALTARFRLLQPPLGTDALYAFHRGMAVVAIAFLLAHPILMLPASELPARLKPVGAGWAGAIALYLLVLLGALAAARRPLGIPYVTWRLLHGALAAAVVCLGLVHTASTASQARDPVTRAGLWLWILAWVLLLGWVRLVKPLLLLRQPYRVIGVRPEHGGAVTLVLDPEKLDGHRFRAGQFAWLTLDGSPFLARERPFFYSGSAHRAPRLELTVKAVGPFTRRVQEVKPGTRAYVDGPFGHTSIDSFPDADRYLHVAGGIGIAPCISILRTLADRGDRRPHTLVYGSADWDSAAFREDLAELASRIDLKVVHVLEKPPLGWLGETGVVGPELLERHLPRSGRRVCFVCGPDAVVDATEAALAEMGVLVDDIHSERLGWV